MEGLIDFNNIEVAKRIFYGGDAGAKNAIKYNDEVWMPLMISQRRSKM